MAKEKTEKKVKNHRPKRIGGAIKTKQKPRFLHEELVNLICDEIVNGVTLANACEKYGVVRTCFLRSINRDEEEAKRWHAQYMEARKMQAVGWIDELIEISDGPGEGLDGKDRIGRDTLKFRTRQWMMSRLAPRLFGEKVQQEITGAEGGPVQIQQFIDAPQSETYEQFKARKAKENVKR